MVGLWSPKPRMSVQFVHHLPIYSRLRSMVACVTVNHDVFVQVEEWEPISVITLS